MAKEKKNTAPVPKHIANSFARQNHLKNTITELLADLSVQKRALWKEVYKYCKEKHPGMIFNSIDHDAAKGVLRKLHKYEIDTLEESMTLGEDYKKK